MCIHACTHFTSEGYEDVFLYSLWSYLVLSFTKIYSTGIDFCESIVPISCCLNDCNFVILLKQVFPFCSSFFKCLDYFWLFAFSCKFQNPVSSLIFFKQLQF